MFTNSKLAKSVKLACLFGAASTTAIATNVAAQEEGANDVEKIQVTGSRIKRQNLTSVTPVVEISDFEFDISGNLNIEQKLAELPSTLPAFGPSSNNPGDGTATVNLRGLGSARTLVLVNGRRWVPSRQDGVIDLNTIPVSLIENVEIITGGASAVYGSDAVGGVANFILRDDFEGVEFGGQFSTNYADNDNGLYEGVLNAAQQPVPGSTMDGDETLIYAMFGASSADGKAMLLSMLHTKIDKKSFNLTVFSLHVP